MKHVIDLRRRTTAGHSPREGTSRPGGGRPGWPAARRWGFWAAAWCLATLILGVPGAWGAQKFSEEGGYVFHLRNGSRIQTLEFWEEGNDYRIERFGGVIGLNKADVLRIERVQTATSTPTSTLAPAGAAELPRAEASQGVLTQLSEYVAELIDWLRAWITRISGTRRPSGEIVQAGGSQRVVAPSPQGGRPAVPPADAGAAFLPALIFPLIGFVILVPACLFGGKLLGARLFGVQRA